MSTYKTCENCGERVYSLGCTWCDEERYIEAQRDEEDVYVQHHGPIPCEVWGERVSGRSGANEVSGPKDGTHAARDGDEGAGTPKSQQP